MAADGADALVEITKTAVNDAIAAHGADTELAYPETGYGLPAIFAWKGIETMTLAKAKDLLDSFGPSAASSVEDGLAAGEKAMYTAEILESIAYLNGNGSGFVPDHVLRGLGLSLVDAAADSHRIVLVRCRGCRHLEHRGVPARFSHRLPHGCP